MAFTFATSHTVRPVALTPCNSARFPTSLNSCHSYVAHRRIRCRLRPTSPVFGSRTIRKYPSNEHSCPFRSYDRNNVHGTRMSSSPPPAGNVSSQGDIESENKSTSSISGFQYVSWADVEQKSRAIVKQTNGMKFDLILAITRGGLTPAALICEALEIRNILTVTAIFYSDNGQPFYGMTGPRFLSFPSLDTLEGRSVLIVDDVWDSGTTAHSVRSRVLRARPRSVKVAVLHFKPERNRYPGEGPDFYADRTDNWIVYPWEAMSPKSPSCAPELRPDIDSSSEISSYWFDLWILWKFG